MKRSGTEQVAYLGCHVDEEVVTVSALEAKTKGRKDNSTIYFADITENQVYVEASEAIRRTP